MSSGEQIHIIKHLDLEELNQRIKTEKDAKILRRLYFIKFRYEEDTIHEAAQRIGVTNRVGYIWQERWNQKGYEGLIPQYAGGRPSKLTYQQKVELEYMLRQKDLWTSREVHDLILDKFGVDYTIKQVLVIAKKMNMKFAKPYQRDYRRPEDAEDILKKNIPEIGPNDIIGFLDESSPQTTANTQRMLSFNKPVIYKNTTKLRANTFGFYALNGTSVIDFKQNSKKESVCEFLTRIRDNNPKEKVIVILDGFSSHRAEDTIKCAERLGMRLVFLPPYSPDLNPIEYIWKSIKRDISSTFIYNTNHIKFLIATRFEEFSSSLSFALNWISTFIECPISIFS